MQQQEVESLSEVNSQQFYEQVNRRWSATCYFCGLGVFPIFMSVKTILSHTLKNSHDNQVLNTAK